MKEVYIYTPYWLSLGGGEKYLLILATVLSKREGVKITLLSDSQNVTKENLSSFANINLDKINFLSLDNFKFIRNKIPPNSIFICLSNYRLYLSPAKYHVQILQVPYGPITILTIVKKIIAGKYRESVKDAFRLKLLKYASTKSSVVITNSKFVHDVLQSNHKIQSEVIYPPIDEIKRSGFQKKNYILSVGRFFKGLYNEKNYDILIRTFKKLYSENTIDWQYHIVGSAMNDKKTERYLEYLRQISRNYPIYFHVNADYKTLVSLYNEASIFWHAAGYEVNGYKQPEKVEHFGMTTVEAMSADCIPVVINKGGQKEIITHNINGFLWNTPDELYLITLKIIKNEIDLKSIKNEIQKRAQDFYIDRFSKKVNQIFQSIFTQ